MPEEPWRAGHGAVKSRASALSSLTFSFKQDPPPPLSRLQPAGDISSIESPKAPLVNTACCLVILLSARGALGEPGPFVRRARGPASRVRTG
uniref:Uncharacterized protein n=1 Tax=Knipowitschia caucasica TaxID=637954 RepID=A0AAV2LAQ4_KNICA